jgi:hypothetical protein
MSKTPWLPTINTSPARGEGMWMCRYYLRLDVQVMLTVDVQVMLRVDVQVIVREGCLK